MDRSVHSNASSAMHKYLSRTTFIGTCAYMAPEVMDVREGCGADPAFPLCCLRVILLLGLQGFTQPSPGARASRCKHCAMRGGVSTCRVRACRYSQSADIWSFGIVLLELARGRPPHAESSFTALVMSTVHNPAPSLEQHAGAKHKFSPVRARTCLSPCRFSSTPLQVSGPARMLAPPCRFSSTPSQFSLVPARMRATLLLLKHVHRRRYRL
jgi:serine/threonine protein kinase